MKKIVLTLIALVFALQLGISQEKAPSFEKQGDLVKATYYFDNGQVKEVGFFKGEKLHHQWVTYNQEGNITMVAFYNEGLKDGNWYVVDGDAIKKITYKSNKLILVEEVEEMDLSFI